MLVSISKMQFISNTILLLTIIYILIFFLISFIIMTAYNNSIPEINDSYKQMNYSTSIWFTILLSTIGLYIHGRCGVSYRQYII